MHRWTALAFMLSMFPGLAAAVPPCACGPAGGSAPVSHGVGTLAIVGAGGPGAPVETSGSLPIPDGRFVGFVKLDHAKWETFTPETDDERDFSSYWVAGLGYGVTPYLSTYVVLPYILQKLEDNSFNTFGIGDIAIGGALGFKYQDGFRLVPAKQTLDELKNWHFSVYSAVTLPTGDPNLRNADGDIVPTLAPGVGEPTLTLGLSAMKQVSDRGTLAMEASHVWFQEYTYDDGNRTQFGNQLRLNAGVAYRLYTRPDPRLRLDASMEVNYLSVERERTNGLPTVATGGETLYLTPGLRLTYRSVSAAFALKLPTWKDLNEQDQQQGNAGLEDHRIILTLAGLF